MSDTHDTNNRRDLLKIGAGVLTGRLLGQGGPQSGRLHAAETQETARLKITAVTTYLLRHRLKRPFGASVSVPLSTTRETLLVKLETNQGLVGWGETAPISGARGTIDKHLGPRLVGRNPLHYRRLWRDLWGPNFGNGLAVGAVDTAINDLRGKALRMSVSELFGGSFREQVPAYVSALNYEQGLEIEDRYPEVAAAMVKRGHNAIKMRLGRFSVERESAVVANVRKVVGPNVKLMADGNGAYTMATALRMAETLRQYNFEYFEEPLPQRSNNYPGYAELRKRMPLPLAAGEAVDSRAAAKALIDRRAMDIIQPDISLCGGLNEALFIAEMAELAGMRCLPHCWGGDIVIAASAHLLSLLPDPHWGLPTDTPMLELDQSENPFRDGLAKTPLEVRDGKVRVPTGPGLGIEINEDLVKEYAV